jgi:hypothetical protein
VGDFRWKTESWTGAAKQARELELKAAAAVVVTAQDLLVGILDVTAQVCLDTEDKAVKLL